MTMAIRLGLRFLRGASAMPRSRAFLTASGAAVAAGLLLAILAAWHAGRIAQSRSVGQTPHYDSAGTLLFHSVSDRWHGRELERVYVAATRTHAPIPPGLSQIPRVGEAALAPVLADALAAGDAELRARFGDLTVIRIGRSGVTSQAQQLAYVGTRPDHLVGAQRVAWFGDASQVTTLTPRVKLLTALLFVTFVGVPFAGLCGVATRVSASARRRRLVALWTIGVPPRTLRLASAVESAAAVAVGAAVGAGAFQIVRHAVANHLTLHGVRPFADDLALSGTTQIVLAASLVCVALVSGTVLSGSAGWQAARPFTTPRQFGRPPLALVAGGAVLGLVTALRVRAHHGTSVTVILLDITASTLLAGTSLSLAVVVQRAGRWAGGWVRSASGLLIARRLQRDPGAMTRLGAVVLPAVFAIGMSATIGTQFHVSLSEAHAAAELGGRTLALMQSPEAASLGLHARHVPAVGLLPMLWTIDGMEVIEARCDDLRAVSGNRALACPGGRFVLEVDDPLTGQNVAPIGPALSGMADARMNHSVVRTRRGEKITLPRPPGTVHVELSVPMLGSFRAMVIPPDDPALAHVAPPLVWTMIVALPANDSVAVRALRDWAAINNPLVSVTIGIEDAEAVATGYARYGTTVLVLALTACAVGAAGVVIMGVDMVVNRRRELEPLLVVGLPRSALCRVTALEVALPLTAAVLLGVLLATVCGALYAAGRSGARLNTHALLWSGVAGVWLALASGCMAATLVPRTPRRVAARRE